jgi:broad specificity phosphatase PhoE
MHRCGIRGARRGVAAGLVGAVRLLLADGHGHHGRLAAVTHAPVIKLAVVQALRAPAQAVWNLDVAPGSATELHSTPSRCRITAVPCRQPAPTA